MRLQLSKSGERRTLNLVILAVYGVSAWALWALLPPRPCLSIILPEPGNAVAISSDGRTLVTQSYTPGEPRSSRLRAWDLQTGRLKAEFEVHSGPVWEVIVTPDGSLTAAIVGTNLRRGRQEPHLHVYEAATVRETNRFLLRDAESLHRSHVRFSPDGSTLAFTTDVRKAQSVTLWDVPTRKVRAILPGQQGPLAFSPNGRTLATVMGGSDTKIKLWDVMTGRESVPLDHPKIDYTEEMELTGIIPHLSFSMDGASLGMIGFISFTDERRRAEVLEHTILGDSGRSVPAYMLRTWDTGTGHVQAERLSAYVYLTDSYDLTDARESLWESIFILENDGENQEEQLLDPLTGSERLRVRVRGEPDYRFSCMYDGPWYSIRPAPDGRVALLQQWRGMIWPKPGWRDWPASLIPQLNSLGQTPSCSLSIYDLSQKKCIATLDGQSFGCFSPDGRMVATNADDDKSVYIWKVPPGRPWIAILGWAVVPAALVVLSRRWWLRHFSLRTSRN